MIDLRDVTFDYPASTFALDRVDLQVPSGEQTALIGPSGCGKTTLLNLIAGVLLPRRGTLTVDSEVVNQLDEPSRRSFRLTRLGLIFQGFELLDYLSIEDNILLPLRLGADLSVTPALRERALSLADELGIADKLPRHPQALSQGERQRAAVCRALLLQPRLILADEPTGNLDPANKFLVLDLLLAYARDMGATVLTVTHDQALLDRFDKVLDFNRINRWSAT